MARYGFSVYGESIYGAPLLSVFSADPVTAVPVDYGTVFVSWRVPGGTWDQLKVVRNYLGYPVSVDNGDVVYTTTPAESGSSFRESGLRQDHWVYYTIFVYDTADAEWVRAGLARCFVPSDYGGTERMISLIPEIAQSDTLKKFLGVIGYSYDLLRNDVNSLLDLYESMTVSYDLVPVLLQQFGIPVEPELEPEQYRRLLRNAAFLYKVKGTEPGVHGIVAAITGWQCTVEDGHNLLWTSDYSDFVGSIAGWEALLNCSVAWAAPSGPNSGALQMTATATAAASSADITERISLTPDEIAHGTNLMTPNQSGAETNSNGGFDLNNATVARSTAQALDGAASWAITAVAAGNAEMFWRGDGATDPGSLGAIPVVGGHTYLLFSSFRAATISRDVRVGFYLYDASGAQIDNEWFPVVADNPTGWRQAAWVVTTPSNAAFITPTAGVVGAAAGEVHYVDRAAVIPLSDFDEYGYGTNLLGDGGFENGLVEWANSGDGSLFFSADDAYVGRLSAEHQITSTSAGFGGPRLYNSLRQVAGQTYTASIRMKCPTGFNVYMQVDGPSEQHFGNSVASDGTWQLLTVTWTAVNTGDFFIAAYRPSATNSTALFDAAKVEKGSVATPYVPRSYSNLFANPSLEDTSLSNYTGGASNTAVSDTAAYLGSHSALVTRTNTSAGSCYIGNTSLRTIPGVTYTASAYVRKRAGSGQVASIAVWGAAFIAMSPTVDLDTVGETWTRLTVTWTATTQENVNVLVCDDTSPNVAVGNAFNVDCFQAVLGRDPLPYIDGAFGLGYSWNASENLLSAENAEFEGGTVGDWVSGVGSAATVANSTAQAYSGTHSLLVSWTTTGGDRGANVNVFSAPDLVGATYAVSAEVFTPVAQNMKLALSDNITLEQEGAVIAVPANTWVRLTEVFTVRNTGSYIGFKVYAANPGAAGSFYIDNAQVEQRDHVTPYGSTGAANQTTSIKQAGARALKFSLSALVRALDLSTATASVRLDWYDKTGTLLRSDDSAAVMAREGADTVVRLTDVEPPDNAAKFSPVLVIHSPTAAQRWQWRQVMVNRGSALPYESGRDVRVLLDITDTDPIRRAVHLDRLGEILPRYLPFGATFTLLDAAAV